MLFQKSDTIFIVYLLLLSGLFCPFVLAQQQGNLEPDDILKMDCLKQFILTADEKNLVYFVSKGDDLLPPGNNGTLRMIRLGNGEDILLTNPGETVMGWSVSPDSSRVAYSAMPSSGGDQYLSLVYLSSGKIEKIDNVPDELLNGFSFAGPSTLVYNGAPSETTGNKVTANIIIMDENPAPVVLKSYDISSGKVTELTTNSDVIYQYKPSPDGRYIFYKSSVYPESWIDRPVFSYYLLDVETGTEDEILTHEEGFEDTSEFSWSPDSTEVYFEGIENGGIHYPIRYLTNISVYTPATKKLEQVPMKWDRKLHQDIFNSDVELNPFNGGVYALLADGANPKLAKYTRSSSGWNMEVLEGKHQGNIFALETTANGRTIYYNYNTASIPPQIYQAVISQNTIVTPRKLTTFNKELLEKDLGTSRVIEWTGALNDTVQGILRYPPGYKMDKRYPLVFVIHGGPTYTDFDSWRDTWEFPYHLITDTGVIALSANYHGSSNFGFDFAASIEGGGYYDLPVEDFIKGIAYLESEKIIDSERIATTGWSNGGILTLAFITRYNGLKAAVCGAGSVTEHAQVANTNGIVMNLMYHNHTPFQDQNYYDPLLGVYHTDNVTTPLLMLQGTEDKAVDPDGAIATYRAYKMGSRSDVQMILFKGEPHHMKHADTQARKVQEEIDWLTRHLFSS